MKKSTTVFLITSVFALLLNNAKAQTGYPILTTDSLPYKLDQPSQIIGLDVNSNEEIEFAIFFRLNPNPSPDVTDYLSDIISRHKSGLLMESELFTIPPTFSPITEIDNFPPLYEAPESTLEFPYISLFPEGIRIENTPPNQELTWGNHALFAGDIFTLYANNNQAPLESSYIDGVTSGYIGARYNNEDGETFYGWIEISVDDAAPSVTIESMMFQEIPERRSYTGSMSIVPIACISSLFGFFAIGIGVYFRRRKNK